MVRIEANKGVIQLATQGYKKDIAAECISAAAALARKLAEILDESQELALMLMASGAAEVLKNMEQVEET